MTTTTTTTTMLMAMAMANVFVRVYNHHTNIAHIRTHANNIRWLSTHKLFKTFGKSICCRFFFRFEASIEMRANKNEAERKRGGDEHGIWAQFAWHLMIRKLWILEAKNKRTVFILVDFNNKQEKFKLHYHTLQMAIPSIKIHTSPRNSNIDRCKMNTFE